MSEDCPLISSVYFRPTKIGVWFYGSETAPLRGRAKMTRKPPRPRALVAVPDMNLRGPVEYPDRDFGFSPVVEVWIWKSKSPAPASLRFFPGNVLRQSILCNAEFRTNRLCNDLRKTSCHKFTPSS